MKIATVIRDDGKSGIDTETRSHEILATISENQGTTGGIHDKSQKSVTFSQETKSLENENNNDINEIIFTDPKRRRVAHDTRSSYEDMVSNPQEEDMDDSIQEEQLNQKT